MKTLGEIAKVIDLNTFKQESENKEQDSIKTAEIINWLFKQIIAMSPAYKQAWSNNAYFEAAKRQWVLGFQEAKLFDMAKIHFGLSRLRASGSDFIPSVGKFIKMCTPTPEDLGLPSLHLAYAEACRNAHPCAGNEWSHEVVRFAGNSCKHEIVTLSSQESKKIFAYHYEIATRKFINGEKFDYKEPEKALEEQPIYNDKLKEQTIADLRKLLGMKK